MGSLFDNPDDKDHTNHAPEDGILPADLIGLPPAQVMIVRLILGQREMTYAQICETVDVSPDRLSRAELDETLNVLLEQHWLICDESGVYRVNLRRKSAGPVNTVVPRRRSSTMQGLWNALDFDTDSPPPTDTSESTKGGIDQKS